MKKCCNCYSWKDIKIKKGVEHKNLRKLIWNVPLIKKGDENEIKWYYRLTSCYWEILRIDIDQCFEERSQKTWQGVHNIRVNNH